MSDIKWKKCGVCTVYPSKLIRSHCCSRFFNKIKSIRPKYADINTIDCTASLKRANSSKSNNRNFNDKMSTPRLFRCLHKTTIFLFVSQCVGIIG